MFKRYLSTISSDKPLGLSQWTAREQWLLAGLLCVVLVFNFILALTNQFDSSIFVSYRYEAFLAVRNAIEFNSGTSLAAQFFFSDTSTSFDEAQHPLYYFHNLNGLHFLTGLIQYFTAYWGPILFSIAALMFCGSVLALFGINVRQEDKFLFLAFVMMALLSPKGLLWAPQNLFVATILFSVIMHFVLLRRLVHGKPERRDAIMMFLIASLLTMAETNSAMLVCILSIFYSGLSGVSSLLTTPPPVMRLVLRFVTVPLLTGIPIVASRLAQLAAIYANDLQDLYLQDMAFTRKIKVDGGISLPEAIDFYAEKGLTFFGVIGHSDIAQSIDRLYSYYMDEFTIAFVPIMVLAFLTIFVMFRQFSFGGNGKAEEADREDLAPDLIASVAAYMVCFVLATFIILPISGQSLNNIALSKWAIFDIAVLFRAGYIVFPALLSLALLRWGEGLRLNVVRGNINGVFAAMILLMAVGTDFLYVRNDPLTYKDVLRSVPPKSDIITNFDIGPVHVEAQSRVTISWFVSDPPECDLENAETLLRMYRTNPPSEPGSGQTFLLLAYFQPYVGESREVLRRRHCIERMPNTLIYEDANFGLYRLTK